MKYIVTLGLLSCVTVLSQGAPHCHMSELWSCAEIAIDWLHSLPKRQIGHTEEQLVVFCNEINKATGCALSYRDNCTTPLQKEVIALVIEGALDLQKDFCTPGSSSRTKYLAHAECLNKVSQMDEVKEQLEYIMAVFEKAQSVPSNQWFNYGCCGYGKVMNWVKKLARDNCGEEAVVAGEEILAMAIGQLPDVICGGYEGDEDHCKAVLPPKGSKPSDDVKGLAIYKFVHDLLRSWLD